MKLLIALVVCASAAASGKDLPPSPLDLTAYDYHRRFGIPHAEEIRKFEEQLQNDPSRIVGGIQVVPGQAPYVAGLITDIVGIQNVGVCGGSLISTNRVLTAAHCWFDGVYQAWRFSVVLGSVFLFSGGTRIETSAVAVHPNWSHLLIRNDLAVIYLPSSVPITNIIAPIALPSGPELDENFAGLIAQAAGYGITSDGAYIIPEQSLNQVSLSVITNFLCSLSFPLIVQSSNVCTSGANGQSICQGDSGGPLVIIRNNAPLLIGVASFGSANGCEQGYPAAFSRVTSYIQFINQHL